MNFIFQALSKYVAFCHCCFQEVSCFGKEGEASDSGDHFNVICDGNLWRRDDQVQLKHVDTGNYLAIRFKIFIISLSYFRVCSGQKYGRPIAGQREVVTTDPSGYNSYWLAAEGIFIKPPKFATERNIDEL